MSEPKTATPPTPYEDLERERTHLSYEGTRLPGWVALVWISFLVFGFIYFALYIL